jgi:hypothetical protein
MIERQAGEWLAERGFGKAPVVVDISEEPPQVTFSEALRVWIDQLRLNCARQ